MMNRLSFALQHLLHSQGIHHSCQHTHLIRLDTIAPFSGLYPAKEITTADDYTDLGAKRLGLNDFIGNLIDYQVTDAETLLTGKRFPRKFQKNAFIWQSCFQEFDSDVLDFNVLTVYLRLIESEQNGRL